MNARAVAPEGESALFFIGISRLQTIQPESVFDDAVWKTFDPVVLKMSRDISRRVGERIVPELRSEYEKSGIKAQGIPRVTRFSDSLPVFRLSDGELSALRALDVDPQVVQGK